MSGVKTGAKAGLFSGDLGVHAQRVRDDFREKVASLRQRRRERSLADSRQQQSGNHPQHQQQLRQCDTSGDDLEGPDATEEALDAAAACAEDCASGNGGFFSVSPSRSHTRCQSISQPGGAPSMSPFGVALSATPGGSTHASPSNGAPSRTSGMPPAPLLGVCGVWGLGDGWDGAAEHRVGGVRSNGGGDDDDRTDVAQAARDMQELLGQLRRDMTLAGIDVADEEVLSYFIEMEREMQAELDAAAYEACWQSEEDEAFEQFSEFQRLQGARL